MAERKVLFEKVQSLWEDLSCNKTFCTFKSLPSSSDLTNTYNVPFAVRNVHVPFSAMKGYAGNTLRTARDLVTSVYRNRRVLCLSPSYGIVLFSTLNLSVWVEPSPMFYLSLSLPVFVPLRLCADLNSRDVIVIFTVKLVSERTKPIR